MILNFRQYKYIDWPLFLSAVLLMLFSLTALFSMSLGEVISKGDVLKQALFVLTGIFWIFFLARFDFRAWRFLNLLLYIAGIFLLLGVLFFGQTLRGTTGWFIVGELSFQPVEFVKIALVLFLATLISGWEHVNRSAYRLLIIIFVIVFPAALVMAQPDLGSAFVLLIIGVGMSVAGVFRFRGVAILILSLIALAFFMWFFVLSDWQQGRVLSFVDPGRDPLGRGYNLRQSLIAVGSGGILGKGLGAGSQGQLRFLPEASTDFIFALIAEELGFVGASVVISLFAIMFYRLWKLMLSVHNHFHLLLVWGLSLMIVVPVFVNIGMNIGLFPVTGLPLLFVSRGGSSLWSSLMALGILESVVIRERRG